MALFCMLASEQIRDFWKKCEMRPKWRCLMQRNMCGKTKTQHINKNTSQQLSGTVESGVVIVCRELCINANLRTSMNWNNALKKSVPIPPQWCEVLQKTILQIIEKVALHNLLDHRVYSVYSILVLRRKHVFSHHCTCIWSSLLLCFWIGYTQSW